MKRRSLILLQVLFAVSAYADDDAASGIALVCDAKDQNQPYLMIALPSNPQIEYQRSLGRRIEHIDTSPLIRHDTRGLRTGSNSVERQCGPITIAISADYFNANAAGRSGYGDFSVITATIHRKPLLAPTAIGACDASHGLAWGRCPEDWATLVEIIGRNNGASIISLSHEFFETRKAP